MSAPAENWKDEYVKKAVAEANSVYKKIKALYDRDNSFNLKSQKEKLEYCQDKFKDFYKANIPVLSYMAMFNQYSTDAYRRWTKLKIAKGAFSQGDSQQWAEGNAQYTKLLLTSLKLPPQYVAQKYNEALEAYKTDMDTHQQRKKDAEALVDEREKRAKEARRKLLMARLHKLAKMAQNDELDVNVPEDSKNDD